MRRCARSCEAASAWCGWEGAQGVGGGRCRGVQEGKRQALGKNTKRQPAHTHTHHTHHAKGLWGAGGQGQLGQRAQASVRWQGAQVGRQRDTTSNRSPDTPP